MPAESVLLVGLTLNIVPEVPNVRDASIFPEFVMVYCVFAVCPNDTPPKLMLFVDAVKIAPCADSCKATRRGLSPTTVVVIVSVSAKASAVRLTPEVGIAAGVTVTVTDPPPAVTTLLGVTETL